jgi:hypothetical protein
MRFVVGAVARKATGDRPQSTGIELFKQHSVRHQPRDTSIAVDEGVYPEEAGDRPARASAGLSRASPVQDRRANTASLAVGG